MRTIRQSNHSGATWRSGLTLVEAIAGVSLLATLLAAVLLAGDSFKARARQADAHIEACDVAEGLLKMWWPNVPRSSQGTLTARHGWAWRTYARPASAAAGAEIVVLEVRPVDDPAPEKTTSVELLMPGGVQ